MNPIHVVGIGLEGAAGLSGAVQEIIEGATLLVGSDRHLAYFPQHPAQRLTLSDISQTLHQVKERLSSETIVILVSGDPLFFGLGRLLLTYFPPEQLCFHPHVSSVQLAFSRVKVPWQGASIISIHGRDFDELVTALQKGASPIAVLTDPLHAPGAIARLLLNLDLPTHYQFWVCENLGGTDEQIHHLSAQEALRRTFAPLNIVILVQKPQDSAIDLNTLPALGIPDRHFHSFGDRPGLITKREIRLLILGELELQPKQTIWDIGAGTGSVSMEIGRLVPTAYVYAIEKTAAGIQLIQKNAQRFRISNVVSIQGKAPDILRQIPAPHRVFIGGTGEALQGILACCLATLLPGGKIVMALATLEHWQEAIAWIHRHQLTYRVLQVQVSRSLPVGRFTRFAPLNPVILLTIEPFNSTPRGGY
ncbi:precorrin-6y C5,15-methyltransferase (decarboxylating) subunit CbiE [Roseofilum capinflatum]|uniref:Precorrin-6y C5,15-methyltransferase (Decarboxylating) subunit CbiE n=1 Tax=Roseofilum capinflatum BLCC-M114 TaxID=3022440 RepID=A0ABT7BAR9_9CYAN|nr:precorrin-6y C5,15-methyltransferase (decarboxylating) subunit CbiE [Roseofilum capinflatum]MDJ1176252.1 precorrin-6y C5,15-methyltransferase (decarboxylating) subunit CbiE [Roseofilum capinflatum BLCC-M114]